MRAAAILLALAVQAWSVAARAEVLVLTGVIEGAYYRIHVPEAWNGDLSIFNTGYGFGEQPRPPTPWALGPLASLQLAQGLAVAATSYRLTQWALFQSGNDVHNLLERFRSEVGEPRRTYLVGASMGALVSAEVVERQRVEADGVLHLCGTLAGSRMWDGFLDLRLAYDAVCAGVPGAELPGGAAGLPADSELTTSDVFLALDRCTGLSDPDRSPAHQERLDRLAAVTTVDPGWLLVWMRFATFGLADLVHDPHKLAGEIGVGNAGVTYEDPELDAAIERVTPSIFGRLELEAHYTPFWGFGDAKIVSLHTSGDGLAPVEHETSYAAVMRPDRLTTAVVVEGHPSHCGFSPSEVEAAWNALVAWVDGNPQPTPADLQERCQVESPGGYCRIDPTFEIGDLDDRLRPRRGSVFRILASLLSRAAVFSRPAPENARNRPPPAPLFGWTDSSESHGFERVFESDEVEP